MGDKISKVIKINEDEIIFDDGYKLYSHHDTEGGEAHYLCFEDLNLNDFDGLEFNLNDDSFFERVEDYGIRLLPINGLPVSIPGYYGNDGCYSHELLLVLAKDEEIKRFDISECQSEANDDDES